VQLLVLGVILFLAFPVAAQVSFQDEMELFGSYVETDRKAVLIANLDFTEEESAIFWPVHKQYRYSVNLTNDRLVKLIKKFADNYDNLSDEMASELMIDSLDIEEDKLILKRMYTEKLLDVLPPNKVARFFQLENKMDAYMRVGLTEGVPLIKPKVEDKTELN
jgi:hypothetical protein